MARWTTHWLLLMVTFSFIASLVPHLPYFVFNLPPLKWLSQRKEMVLFLHLQKHLSRTLATALADPSQCWVLDKWSCFLHTPCVGLTSLPFMPGHRATPWALPPRTPSWRWPPPNPCRWIFRKQNHGFTSSLRRVQASSNDFLQSSLYFVICTPHQQTLYYPTTSTASSNAPMLQVTFDSRNVLCLILKSTSHSHLTSCP